MRLSDLLRAEVVDEQGRALGRVHDVRMVKDGRPMGAFGPAYRVSGLVVGRSAVGARLGYDRGRVKGPWMLVALWGRRSARTYIPWGRVRDVQAGRIRVEGQPEPLPPVDLDTTPGD